ncbi:MAG TPA: hypothetical protein VFC34_04255, partial [Puia sp.]|nr:hypothetical protein [Puia sp.]
MSMYPRAKDPDLIGEYPALVKSGGGYVWAEVLEYRVWYHPHDGAVDIEEGYIHVKERRLTEWPVEFLNRPKRTETTISDFL